jgi:formylglycine-generating enzyme required for sulfatase activity
LPDIELAEKRFGWVNLFSERENPIHQVSVKEFYLGKYSVTQEQWQAVMGNNPSYFSGNPQNPVEQVSWNDCQEFCQKLSQITGKTYRLPSEAE